MNKSLKIDLLTALYSDLQLKRDQGEVVDATIVTGLELIIAGLERDDLQPINFTVKFFVDFACKYEPIINFIISSGEVNEILDNGKTLLMLAASCGYFYVCRCLILNNADIHKVVDGYNAFDYAYDNEHGIVSWLFFKLGSHLTGDRFEKTEDLLQTLSVPVGFACMLNQVI